MAVVVDELMERGAADSVGAKTVWEYAGYMLLFLEIFLNINVLIS